MSKVRIPFDMHIGLETHIEDAATTGAVKINELHRLDHKTDYDPDFIFFNEVRRRAAMRRLAEYQVEQEKHTYHIVDLLREETKGTPAMDSVISGGDIDMLIDGPNTERIIFETPDERYERMASVTLGRPMTGDGIILHEGLAVARPPLRLVEGIESDE